MTPLVAFTAAWVLSIVLAQAALFPPTLFLLALPIALVLQFGWRHYAQIPLIVWALAGLALGGLRFQLTQQKITAHNIAYYNGTTEITLIGVVNAEPKQKPSQINLKVAAESICINEDTIIPVHGNILVQVPLYTPVQYGDRIQAKGNLETPPVFEEFSYRDYLARQQIYTLMRRSNIIVLESNQASPILRHLYRFKNHALKRLLAIQPEPQASLLAGILLGIETGIPDKLTEAFSTTGTSHIIAISGANLMVVANLFALLLRKSPAKKLEIPITFSSIWLYTILVGGSAAVVRAAIMTSLTLLARQENRYLHGPTTLAAVIVVMSTHNPMVLWDVGFQLSLAATAGLLFLTEPLTKTCHQIIKKATHTKTDPQLPGWLNEALILTLAAQITTMPILAATFRHLSVVSLITNFLIIPLQSAIMVLGALALITALLSPLLGQIVGWLVWVPLTLTIEAVKITAELPFASITLPEISPLCVWVYYSLISIGRSWLLHSREERKAWLTHLQQRPQWEIIGALITATLVIATISTLPDGKLHIYFLDAGNEGVVFIETPNRKQILIDGSADTRQFLSELNRHIPFWDHSLDLVILTAPTDARLQGLIPILERYKVNFVAIGLGKGQSAAYEHWCALLKKYTPETVQVLQAGSCWRLDQDITLQVLWPDPPEETASPLVLKVTHDEIAVLLTSDITTLVEEHLAENLNEALQSDILQVARHGDKTACTPAFLQAVAPEAAIISVCDNNRSGNPAPQTLARLMNVKTYRTDKHGTIEIVSNGKEYQIQTDHNNY